jgi:ArsR family transcriptional regulator, arsenate/arsenite/antimonite-responsive transcriptional repressor
MPDEIDVLRALAHPVRWGILERLAAEPGICACSFTEFFDVSQPTISAHLKALRQAGLVTTQRRGTEIWYSLARDQLTPLAGRLAGMASADAPVVPAPVVPAPAVPVAVPRARPPAPAAVPGRLADVVAAAAARISGGLAELPDPPLAKRPSGGLAAAAAAAQAAATAARGSGAGGAAAGRPAGGQPSRGLADMAAMAQAAVPRPAGRRGRTAAPPTRLHAGRAAVPAQAGSAED